MQRTVEGAPPFLLCVVSSTTIIFVDGCVEIMLVLQISRSVEALFLIFSYILHCRRRPKIGKNDGAKINLQLSIFCTTVCTAPLINNL